MLISACKETLCDESTKTLLASTAMERPETRRMETALKSRLRRQRPCFVLVPRQQHSAANVPPHPARQVLTTAMQRGRAPAKECSWKPLRARWPPWSAAYRACTTTCTSRCRDSPQQCGSSRDRAPPVPVDGVYR